MSDFKIRDAQIADLPDIGDLWRELQQASASFEPRLAPTVGATAWFMDYLHEQIGTPTAAVLVAEAQGMVVGYAFGQILRRPTVETGDCGYIADVCVRNDYRGCGIGKSLYERLRAWFLSRGVGAIEVQVVRANPASQTFWRKMGFHEFLRTLRKEL